MKALIITSLFFVTLLAHALSEDSWELKHYEDKFGARNYKLFIPGTVKPLSSHSPLVVMLHGCKQNPDDFAGGTEMNDLAKEHRFSVLYPEQPNTANALNCWNWYDEANQVRDNGEPAILVGMVQQVLKNNPFIDSTRIYVAGMSAGGAMAHILGVCYPDIFAASGIHSGVGYGFATTFLEGYLAMSKGTQRPMAAVVEKARKCPLNTARVTPTLILHGRSDTTVALVNAEQMLELTLSVAGLSKESSLLASEKNIIGMSGSTEGYFYGYDTYGANKLPVVKKVTVETLGHAWCGGNPNYPYNDKNPPKASALLWDFFKQFKL